MSVILKHEHEHENTSKLWNIKYIGNYKNPANDDVEKITIRVNVDVTQEEFSKYITENSDWFNSIDVWKIQRKNNMLITKEDLKSMLKEYSDELKAEIKSVKDDVTSIKEDVKSIKLAVIGNKEYKVDGLVDKVDSLHLCLNGSVSDSGKLGLKGDVKILDEKINSIKSMVKYSIAVITVIGILLTGYVNFEKISTSSNGNPEASKPISTKPH